MTKRVSNDHLSDNNSEKLNGGGIINNNHSGNNSVSDFTFIEHENLPANGNVNAANGVNDLGNEEKEVDVDVFLRGSKLEFLLDEAEKSYEKGKGIKYFDPLKTLPRYKIVLLMLALYFIRTFLILCRWIYKYFWCPLERVQTPDLCPVYKGLAVKRGIKYGSNSREHMDCVIPVPERHEKVPDWISMLKETIYNTAGTFYDKLMNEKSIKKAVFFVPGGGFAIEGSDLQLQQLTPWARKGFTVFSINYPLSPEHKFPTSLISVLKAMRFLKEIKNVDEIHVVGESAGANLTSLMIAMISNRRMLSHLQDLAHKDWNLREFANGNLLDFKFPKIKSYSCWYGMMDKHSWKSCHGKFLGFDSGVYSIFKYGVDACFQFYEGENIEEIEKYADVKCTLYDYKDELENFNCKYVQFISGSTDPLGLQYSNLMGHKLLRDLNVKIRDRKGKTKATDETQTEEIKIEHLWFDDMTHGFVAYPPQVQKVFMNDVSRGCNLAGKHILRFLQAAEERS